MGMRSAVRLAARMPAVRATPSTSPLGALPSRMIARVADVMRRTARATASRDGLRLGGDIDHAGVALRGEVAQTAERLGSTVPRHGKARGRGRQAPTLGRVCRAMASMRSLAISFSFLSSLILQCWSAESEGIVVKVASSSLVTLVLGPEATELLVLGHESCCDVVLIHASTSPENTESQRRHEVAGLWDCTVHLETRSCAPDATRDRHRVSCLYASATRRVSSKGRTRDVRSRRQHVDRSAMDRELPLSVVA